MSNTRRKTDEEHRHKEHSKGELHSKRARFTPHGKDFRQFLDEDEFDEIDESIKLDKLNGRDNIGRSG